MYFKLVNCLCFSFVVLTCTKSQRINSWASPQSSYFNDNSGFSNWNNNNDNNAFPVNQNSELGSWQSNVPNDVQSGSNFGENYLSWGLNSFSKSNKPSDIKNNKNSGLWGSNYFESNRRPKEKVSSNSQSAKDLKWDRKVAVSDGKGSVSSDFNSNKTPKNQKSDTGNSGNWQSDAFSINNKPNEKKSASIMNSPTSTNWDIYSNKLPSDFDEKTNSVYSSWGSSNNEKNSKTFPGLTNGQSTNSESWNSNSFDSNNNNNDNTLSSDYEANLGYSSLNSENKKSKPPSKSYENEWDKKQSSKNSKNSVNAGWDAKNAKKSNDKKSSAKDSPKKSGTNSWNSSINNRPNDKKPSSSRDEKNTATTNQPLDHQSGKKISTPDTSILDELDENDWYFGKESDYPKPPFKSTLNIDVSELWNLDGNKKTNQNFEESNNYNRRRNRETGQLGTGMQCECVDVSLCDEGNVIGTKEDLRGDWRPFEEFQCARLTEVCCTHPKMNQFSSANFIEEIEEVPLRCGQSRIGENFGDTTALTGEFPWSLGVENFEDEFICMASLLHPKMALTAAHCVQSWQFSDLKVTAGLWNTNNEPLQSRRVLKIILHPDYDGENPRNDIALLVLENSFELSPNLNTVCLPVTNDKWDLNQCFVAGWRPKEIDGEIVDVLEKERVDFLPQNKCQNFLLVTQNWWNYILQDSFSCAVQKDGKDSCLRKEGSFIVCPSQAYPNTYIQIGIVSSSKDCSKLGRPVIFTNVLKFVDWINENTFDLDLFDDFDIRSVL